VLTAVPREEVARPWGVDRSLRGRRVGRPSSSRGRVEPVVGWPFLGSVPHLGRACSRI